MNASLSYSQNRQNKFDPPPVLVAASSDAARDRAQRTVEASGLRLADVVAIDVAPARIEVQAAASALWVEFDRDCGGAMDELLDCLNRDIRDQRYSAVVSASRDLVDPLAARLDDAIDLIIDADDMERAAALAVAVARRGEDQRFSDVTADKNAARLRQLSEEVSRIASTLARLSTGPAATVPRAVDEERGEVPPVSAETVRAVIRARRLRARYFPGDLFADPAWDMLLDLLQAEIAQLRVPVSSLCIAAAVPATTALRWLKTMTQQGIFVRRADPHDGRRVFVELSADASHAMRRYFAEVGKPVMI